MIRFQCIHCGERIAVNDRDTGRLARCPECGGVTHPLAEHLVTPTSKSGRDGPAPPVAAKKVTPAPAAKKNGAAKKAVPAKAAPKPAPVEESVEPGNCDNCGKPFGKLQKPMSWKDHQVCGPCYQTLSMEHGNGLGAASAVPVTAIEVRTDPGRVAKATLIDARQQPFVAATLAGYAASNKNVALRGAIIGLMLTAGVICLIVVIVQLLSKIIYWIAAVALLAAAVYLVRRWFLNSRNGFAVWTRSMWGKMAIRRTNRPDASVRAIVRE